MWVLAPLPGLNAASQAAEAQPQHQTIYLTASGEISIGRPLKKGSTVGKADILIFNEQSVSSIHATLHVEAAAGSSQQDGDFTHGSLSITDISRFGTFLTRDGEAKLPSKAPVTLQDGDVLKFGSHTRYRVQQQSVVLIVSTTCQDQHPQLQSTAATLNCHLTTSWPSPAAAAAAAVTEAAEEQEGGSVQAYCVVQPAGELLTPALLRALTTEGAQVLVTPAWLEAVAARRAWPGELPSPNQQPEHRPVSLLLPGQAQQQQQQLLQLSLWSKPDPELLSGYMLVFGKGCQDDLAAAAAACGATTLLLGHHRGRAPTMATLHKQAAQAGQRAILIHPSEAFQQQQQQQRKQRTPQKQQAGKAEQLASLSEVQLLLAVEQHSAEPLQQVTDAFAAEHNQQQQPASPAPPAAAAAAGGSQGGDETEADVTEGEEEQEQDGGPAAAGQATPPPAAAGGGTAAAGAGDGADAALRGPVGLLPVSPAAGAGATQQQQQQQQQPRPAVSTAGLTEADGWHTHAPSSSIGTQAKTQGRTAGSKRGAAELTAAATAAAAEPEPEPAAAATPSKRRRTAAAGASPTKSALTVKRKGRQQQQAQPGPGSGFDVQQGSADGAGVQGLGTGPEQQQGQQGLGCSTEVVVPLCVTTPDHQPPSTVAVGGGPEVPNYKAFRRRGEAQQQQQQQQQVVVVAIDLVAADAAHLQGPDIDAFLRDEQHRQDRLRKADELFHAHLKPIKAPAAAAAAAAGGRAAGKTAAAAGRGRKK